MTVESRPTVLIVDDAEAVCLTLSMMLEKHGFHTQAAHHVDEALRRTEQTPFDAIIVDRNLGSESGLELAQRLLQANPAQPIVIISGSVTIRAEIEAHQELSAIPVLQKPFTRQEFFECLRAIMNAVA
jgi:two-component system response regulator AtoC